MPDPDDELRLPPSTSPNIKQNGTRRYARPADLAERGVKEGHKTKLAALGELIRMLVAFKRRG
jgi:hypothetical protein